MLLQLAAACRDVARFQHGPLPGAFRRTALRSLESGEMAIHAAPSGLDVAILAADPASLANVNAPHDLEALALA